MPKRKSFAEHVSEVLDEQPEPVRRRRLHQCAIDKRPFSTYTATEKRILAALLSRFVYEFFRTLLEDEPKKKAMYEMQLDEIASKFSLYEYLKNDADYNLYRDNKSQVLGEMHATYAKRFNM